MSESNVRVELRHVVLAESAALTEHEDGRVFVALDEPPPVRSVLALFDATKRRAIEVVRVVEVADAGGARGVHGRVVDSDALARFAAVGTERLPGGTKEPVSTQPNPEPVRSDDDTSAQLAMPAPVMVVEADSEPIDVGESEASDDAEGGDNGDGGENQTKKRKGRKRR
jgi:hypothetical protein